MSSPPCRQALTLLLLLSAGAAAEPTPSEAQGQEGRKGVGASVVIHPPAAVASGVQDLRFGTVLPGSVVEVLPGPATAGAVRASAGWRVESLTGREELLWSLSLPQALVSPAGRTIPVEWDGEELGLACGNNGPGSCPGGTAFNPDSLTKGRFQALPGRRRSPGEAVSIYVGARSLIPAVPPGSYSGRVVVWLALFN